MPADLTQAAGGVMVLFFLALILHSLWQLGRRFPPVIDQAPSGVEGWLMAVASLAVAAGLFNLTSFGLLLNAALTDAARSGGFPAGFWTAYGLPAAVGFAGYLWAALRLITGRRPSVRLEAALGFWLSGPAAELPALLAGRGDSQWAAVSAAAALAVTLYLFFCARPRPTYGV